MAYKSLSVNAFLVYGILRLYDNISLYFVFNLSLHASKVLNGSRVIVPFLLQACNSFFQLTLGQAPGCEAVVQDSLDLEKIVCVFELLFIVPELVLETLIGEIMAGKLGGKVGSMHFVVKSAFFLFLFSAFFPHACSSKQYFNAEKLPLEHTETRI